MTALKVHEPLGGLVASVGAVAVAAEVEPAVMPHVTAITHEIPDVSATPTSVQRTTGIEGPFETRRANQTSAADDVGSNCSEDGLRTLNFFQEAPVNDTNPEAKRPDPITVEERSSAGALYPLVVWSGLNPEESL